MIIAIHQPNFLPWLGYFYKILNADIFVIIDNVQFVKNSICNRNKIKDPNGNPFWITVPVRRSKGLMINFNELEINYAPNWQKKIIKQIESAYHKTLYFKSYFSEFENIIKEEYVNLAQLNIILIKQACSILQINTPIYISSETGIDFGKKNEMLVNITNYFEGTVYFSGRGAKKYNDEELFKKNNIELRYTDFQHPVYSQIGNKFIPNLSIIDLLFNCGEKSGSVLAIV